MKNKKLNLAKLEVTSFMPKQKSDVKGGCPVYTDTVQPCTLPIQCDPTNPRACATPLWSACGNPNVDCY